MNIDPNMIKVGPFDVHLSPLPGAPMTRYSIFCPGAFDPEGLPKVAYTQISMPNVEQCIDALATGRRDSNITGEERERALVIIGPQTPTIHSLASIKRGRTKDHW